MEQKYKLLLNQLLLHNLDKQLIKDLYLDSNDIAIELILDFFNQQPQLSIPRKTEISKNELADTSQKVSQIFEFRKGERLILKNLVPELDVLNYFYNSNNNMVAEHFSLFIQMEIKRKCGLPYVSHLYRVSATLNMLFESSKDRFFYSSLAAIHDSFEDLPIKIASQQNSFSFSDLDKFLDNFVGKNFIDGLLILSNVYDLLLSYADYYLMEKELAINQKNIAYVLKKFYNQTSIFKDDIEKLLVLLESISNKEDLFRDLRWQAYIKHYLPKIVQKCVDKNNYSLIELKTLDLIDNAWGMKALDLTGKLRQILKRQNFINLVKFSGINCWSINQHINELQNLTLKDAIKIILEFLSNDRLRLDYLKVALQTITTLKSVLTVN
ncbi:MAG: hypothetical protein V1773_02115 [bacterium]